MRQTQIIIMIFAFLGCSSPRTDKVFHGKDYAEKQLDEALLNKMDKHVLVDTVIRDKETAIRVAENILFNIYGKDNIERQKPYETYLIRGNWIISGTLPKGMLGGTFLIIIDSRDSKVIKLTHGK